MGEIFRQAAQSGGRFRHDPAVVWVDELDFRILGGTTVYLEVDFLHSYVEVEVVVEF